MVPFKIDNTSGGLTVSGTVTATPADSTVSTGNSTTTPLGGGAVFTGTGVDTLGYSAVSMSASSDQISAVSGIEFQWSPDNTNWSTRGVTDLRAARTGVGQATR